MKRVVWSIWKDHAPQTTGGPKAMPPSDPNQPGEDPNAGPLLTILLDRYPALTSVDELVSEYAGATRDRKKAEIGVADGLAALMSSGLIHKLDDFFFASRAAVKAEQLHP